MGTTIYKATIKKVPGTTIYTTTAERKAAEEKEKEKERMTSSFVENSLRFTQARVVAEKAARVARERQMRLGGSGMGGAYREDSSWFLRGREGATKTWVNEDGDVVEERWLEPNPMVSWREGSEDFDKMDGVEESVCEEEEEEEKDD